MTQLIIESQYLPCIEYFYCISQCDTVFLEGWENFQKQTFRNRCEILGANKVDILTVPVIKSGQKMLIRDVKIDYSQNWLSVHWRAFESAYHNSPYFEYYGPYFKDILFKKPSFLFDLNLELMTLCLQLLKWNIKIEVTSSWNKNYEGKSMDLRSKIHPKQEVFPFIGQWIKYRQVFGNNFVKNLSIVDLLFNEGPDSNMFLTRLKTENSEQI